MADPSLPPFLQAIGNLACFTGSSVLPFDSETLDDLYPDHSSYVRAVGESVNDLVRRGFLLRKDARTLKRAAAQSDVGR